MQVKGITTVFGPDNQPLVGIEIHVRMLIPPPTSGVYSYETATFISDINGEIEIDGMFVGAEYAIWGERFERMKHVVDVTDYTTPVDGMDYELPPFMYSTAVDICNEL